MKLFEIQKQIAELQQRADALLAKEKGAAIAQIKGEIQKYGLTAADLGMADRGGWVSSGRKPRAGSTGKATAGARYRDDSGNEWGGRGPRPAWLRQALEQGRSLDEFAVRGRRSAKR
jgi:DNA-binding protein H-NS